MNDSSTVVLDVREAIRNGESPCSSIMAAADALAPGQVLLLRAPFRPTPLFDLMAQKGFRNEARPLDNGDWEVRFSAEAQVDSHASHPANQSDSQSTIAPPAILLDVDTRGLEPPEPMVRILTAAAQLPSQGELHARTDRRPIHLYPHLSERGLRAETEELGDGSFLTRIRRG